MEVSRTGNSANPPFDALSARVVTRAFGVRIGGFGLDYSSREVLVDPDSRGGAGLGGALARAALAAQAGSDAQKASERVFEASWSEAGPALADPPPDHPDPAWRKGLRAYAKARDLLRADAARGRTYLAVA
ncbi:hypothetical protein [Fundidesulfovibrio agrisoli]|uniref:hypothetical protein n=1 Tax=Fundidesulfovibrio agrisoli TaxID=2922717 RepID=UPI001FABD256|nr:hypothetical protein [Fundidesulfovibrio agrisoli]